MPKCRRAQQAMTFIPAHQISGFACCRCRIRTQPDRDGQHTSRFPISPCAPKLTFPPPLPIRRDTSFRLHGRKAHPDSSKEDPMSSSRTSSRRKTHASAGTRRRHEDRFIRTRFFPVLRTCSSTGPELESGRMGTAFFFNTLGFWLFRHNFMYLRGMSFSITLAAGLWWSSILWLPAGAKKQRSRSIPNDHAKQLPAGKIECPGSAWRADIL